MSRSDLNSSDWRQGIGEHLPVSSRSHACNCVGPQPGKPVCPCRMSALQVVDGRYVEVIDHGPATVRSKA